MKDLNCQAAGSKSLYEQMLLRGSEQESSSDFDDRDESDFTKSMDTFNSRDLCD